VRSNEIGFLSNPGRLNVALSRAKESLIILANPHIVNLDETWRHIHSWV